MNMKTNEEILTTICKTRNLSQSTKWRYRGTIKIYTEFSKKSLYELLQEAEQEEQERIRWKDRKLRKRLIEFRDYLNNRYMYSTANSHLKTIQTIYKYYEIELQPLPYISTKQLKHPTPLSYHDLPDKEVIEKALQISSPLMRAIILFITSSGTARTELINIKIKDFIEAVQDYTDETDIHKIIIDIKDKKNIIPTFKLKRKKVNAYYYTFCSPEATTAICDYLLTRKKLKDTDKLFKSNARYLTERFITINNTLGLGKKSTYNRFRTHMLRKYHASTLANNENKLSKQDIDFLQGRSDKKTRQSYFFQDEKKLKLKYAESMNDLTINQKYTVIVDYETLTLHIEEYDPEQELKPLKAQTIELKKENKQLLEENNNIKNDIKTEARKIFEDILKENGIKL